MSDHLEFGLFDRSQETLITYDDLPHWFQPNVSVFITFRTMDSLPQSAVLRMEAELRDWLQRNDQSLHESYPLPEWSDLPKGLQQEYRQRKSKLWHWELDSCHGECVLRNPDLSKWEQHKPMSDYQFVHFIAIDRPLSDEQMEFMQRQSTRATVSRREFSNEYHFGDFHGKSLEMMRRGFDLHLHFANYGIRKLMFRLPAGLPCGKAGFKPFALKYNLEWTPDNKGPGGVLTVHRGSDGGRWDSYVDGLEDLLTELTPVREMLMAGDLRPLYLAWLACNPDEGHEPPVPAGLRKLPAALRVFTDFYEVSDELLQAAVEESAEMDERSVPKPPIQEWLNSQSASQHLSLIEQLLLDDTGIVRADTLAEIRQSLSVAAWPVTRTKRTTDSLC